MGDGRPFQQHFIQMAALGRYFQIGDLYDYRSDCIVTGDETMSWKSNTRSAAVDRDFHFEMTTMSSNDAEFSSNSKETSMRLDNHLVGSVMAGLISDFNGASNYVNHKPDPSQSTLTFVWTGKSWVDQYHDLQRLVNQNVERLKLVENGSMISEATHLVVSVLYGAHVYCVLSQDLGGKEVDKEVQENLSNAVKKLQAAFDRKLDVIKFKEELTKEDTNQLSQIKCLMYSDLQAKPIRKCSLFDMYKHCNELQQQICGDGVQMKNIKGVPIVIQLCPLQVLLDPSRQMFSNKINVYHDLDNFSVFRCCRILAELKRIIISGEKISVFSRGDDLNQVQDQTLPEFITLVSKYQEFLQENLKKAVVNFRRDSSLVHEIHSILRNADDHPVFEFSKLKRWIDAKQAEIDMSEWIASVAGKSVTFLPNGSQLENRIGDTTDKKCALVLCIPPIDENSNVTLEAMKKCRDNSKNDYGFCADVNLKAGDGSPPWHTIPHMWRHVLDYIRGLTKHAEKNQQFSDRVQFIIALGASSKSSNCSYSVYEAGKLVKSNLRQLPGSPTGLRIHHPHNRQAKKAKTSISSIRFEWDYEEIGNPCTFLLEYQLKGSCDSWVQQRTTKPGRTYLNVDVETGSVLKCRVAAETCIGRTEFSDVLDEDSFSFSTYEKNDGVQLQPATEVKVKTVTGTTAELEWTPPSGDLCHVRYLVSYWKKGENSLLVKEQEMGYNCWLENLEPETTYQFNILTSSFYMFKDSEPSETVEFSTTNMFRFAERFVKRCQKISIENGLELYQVPVAKTGQVATAEHYVIDSNGECEPSVERRHLTLLLVGASGSGKTSLINSMVNYIFNVEREDPFRFQLVDPSEDDQKSCVAIYDIFRREGFNTPSSLTIIDTPSYVDDDPAKNQKITDMIGKFFDHKGGIQQVNMVGFVMDSSVPHPTASQFYIYTSLITIFGKGIIENVNFILTSAEKEDPSLWNAIVESQLVNHGPFRIDEENCHKFGSSVCFSSHRPFAGGDESEKLEMWIKNVDKFFFSLSARAKSTSTSLSKQTFDKKERLEATVKGLQERLENALTRLEELKQIDSGLARRLLVKKEKGQKNALALNVNVAEKENLPYGQYVTNCTHCQFTCHSPCGTSTSDERECDVMDHSIPEESRTCRVCPGECSSAMHASSQPFKWVYRRKRNTISFKPLPKSTRWNRRRNN